MKLLQIFSGVKFFEISYVIWSMPKNFAFFQKPLDKFFYKFDNPEINRQEIFPASFKNIENREGF